MRPVENCIVEFWYFLKEVIGKSPKKQTRHTIATFLPYTVCRYKTLNSSPSR